MKRFAIFVSGNGTNMQCLIQKIQSGFVPGSEVAVVISDNPQARAIEKAKEHKVEVVLVDRKQFQTKKDFEEAMIRAVDQRKIDFLLLAGFMRILSKEFVEHFLGRIINIHPSLLPAFPGAHAIRDAFEAKVKETGVTTHFVTAEVDAGPIIQHRKIAIDPQETLESLEAKVHAVEYELYPETLRLVIEGKAKFSP